MMSDNTWDLKKNWMDMPVQFFEYLTFGELKIGQKFISLPVPGDNDGHGGFRGAHYLFTKTHHKVEGFAVPTGKAESRGTKSTCPHSMPIILIAKI